MTAGGWAGGWDGLGALQEWMGWGLCSGGHRARQPLKGCGCAPMDRGLKDCGGERGGAIRNNIGSVEIKKKGLQKDDYKSTTRSICSQPKTHPVPAQGAGSGAAAALSHGTQPPSRWHRPAKQTRRAGLLQGDLAAPAPGPNPRHFPAAELSMTKKGFRRGASAHREEENRSREAEEGCDTGKGECGLCGGPGLVPSPPSPPSPVPGDCRGGQSSSTQGALLSSALHRAPGAA